MKQVCSEVLAEAARGELRGTPVERSSQGRSLYGLVWHKEVDRLRCGVRVDSRCRVGDATDMSPRCQ